MVRWIARSIAVTLVACASPAPPAAPVSPASASASAPAPAAAPRARAAPIVDRGTLRSRFRDCGDGFIGQVLDAPGARCDEVCATFGYSRCRGRAGQDGLVACRAKQAVVGSCTEVFQPGWVAQCDCTNVPLDS